MSGALYPDVSPGLERSGRAAVWLMHQGRLLLTHGKYGAWSLPGGGIGPDETPEQAAVREVWEECGAVAELTGAAFPLRTQAGRLTSCFPASLKRLEASPEGRLLLWVNPEALPWCSDVQISQGLEAFERVPVYLQHPLSVQQASRRAKQNDFEHSSSPAVGRLLQQLAAMRPAGRFLELGSGFRVGTGWLLSGMHEGAVLVTAELDPERAQVVTELLGHDPRLSVVSGDGWPALELGPYDLIFADCAAIKGKGERLRGLVQALTPGGTMLMDNFTPHLWLEPGLAQRLAGGDPLRMALAVHPYLQTTELRVSDTEAVLLATRTA